MTTPQERTISLAGVTITLQASAQETEGKWALVEHQLPPHFSGVAPHSHKATTEAFYILEGTLHLKVGKLDREAPAGSFVLVTPGTVHSYTNQGDQSVRFLVMISPPGMEGFFFAVKELVTDLKQWPTVGVSGVREIEEKFDTFS